MLSSEPKLYIWVEILKHVDEVNISLNFTG